MCSVQCAVCSLYTVYMYVVHITNTQITRCAYNIDGDSEVAIRTKYCIRYSIGCWALNAGFWSQRYDINVYMNDKIASTQIASFNNWKSWKEKIIKMTEENFFFVSYSGIFTFNLKLNFFLSNCFEHWYIFDDISESILYNDLVHLYDKGATVSFSCSFHINKNTE